MSMPSSSRPTTETTTSAACQPFIEAGLPVFVDKPMATNIADLRQFVQWHQAGATILSTSGMRYAPAMRLSGEQRALRRSALDHQLHLQDVGALRHPRARSRRAPARPRLSHHSSLVSDSRRRRHASHASQRRARHHRARSTMPTAALAPCIFTAPRASYPLRLTDTYNPPSAASLSPSSTCSSTGTRPLPFDETVELMAVIIAGIAAAVNKEADAELDPIHIARHPFRTSTHETPPLPHPP
jgi:hypothetical protein